MSSMAHWGPMRIPRGCAWPGMSSTSLLPRVQKAKSGWRTQKFRSVSDTGTATSALGMSEPFNPHPFFRDFHPYEGWSEPGFEPWHFGAQFRDWLFTGKSKGYTERRMVSIGHPELTEEHFDWSAVLRAVATAERHFRMFELGAGWGRWSIAAAMLCRQRHLPFHL